eukprot:g13697.t1
MAASQEDASAGDLAWKIMSGASDAVEFAAELGVQLPFIGPIFKAINAIREKAEKVRTNRQELIDLHEWCSEITACFIVKCNTNSPGVNVVRLQSLIQDVDAFVTDCQQNSGGGEILKPAKVAGKITGLHDRIKRMTSDMGLAGIAAIVKGIIEMKKDMDEIQHNTRDILERLTPDHPPSPMVKLAKVPKGTLAHKSWYVERRRVMDTVFGALTRDGAPPLVGLVGGSGSGKTTAASEIIRSDEARKAFADGVVWLTVNDGAKERLPLLMRQLARMVYEIVGGSVGRPPAQSEDGAEYIKRFVENGHNGKAFKCLVVADNVWEKEVVSKLLETGMSVLVSTRHEELVTGADGEAVGVDELSEEDAKLLLSKAAELPQGARLPDAAEDLVELCGRVAMDLAFVGRWSTVRTTEARSAWSEAAGKIRAEIDKIQRDPENEMAEGSHTSRRKAILRAGFEDLAVGSGNERVKLLYLSLAVMPDGHGFTVKDAAVLLFDRKPSPDDETAVAGVMEILERWSIVRSEEGTYQMLDAHSTFAREKLMDHGYVREPALARWVKHISSLASLRSFESYVLKALWRTVERVGGDEWGWRKRRPYAEELAKVDNLDPSLTESLQTVADFQKVQEDWKGASTTLRRLLEVEKTQLGNDHPIVLGTYGKLAECADRLHEAEEAAEWRKQEREALPLALARMRQQADAGDLEQEEDPKGILNFAYHRRKLGPGDRIAVEKLLRRCLAIFETTLGADHEEVAHTLRKLGIWVRDAGRLEEAEELLRCSLEINQAKLGPDDIWVAYNLHDLGVCVREAGRLKEAADLLRDALRIKEKKLGQDHVQVAYTLHPLGVSLRKSGQRKEAERVLRRCLEIRELKLGPEDRETAHTLHQLGACAQDAGRLKEAEELLRRCLSIKQAELDPHDLGLARTVNLLGMCVREAGRLKEAEEYFRRCLGMVESNLGPQDGTSSNTANDQLDERQRTWLKKAHDGLKRYLSIGEARRDCKCKDVDEDLQQLSVNLREASK